MKPRAYHEGVQATLDGTQVIFFTLQEMSRLHDRGEPIPDYWWDRAHKVVMEAFCLYESTSDPRDVG